jgi:hypothetical protein
VFGALWHLKTRPCFFRFDEFLNVKHEKAFWWPGCLHIPHSIWTQVRYDQRPKSKISNDKMSKKSENVEFIWTLLTAPLHGLDSQPHGLGSQPHGLGSQPHGLGSQPHGLGSQPHGLGSQPHGLGSQPHGLGSQPHGLGSQPHGLGSQPQGLSSQPQGLGSRCRC